MARGMTAHSSVSLHQALHGYADGHRQLALSVPLQPKDQMTLLSLSDMSGPGGGIDDGGYITGYPLTESGYYAIGRTWPARELRRPGCVWTHTLLIDFSDLAIFDTFEWIIGAFRRPQELGSAKSYSSPMEVEYNSNLECQYIEWAWAASVMRAIYGFPHERTIAHRIGTESDSATLAIWSQQWPRLRRNFRFCTQATSDRSIHGINFDLQLMPTFDSSARSRFPGAIDAGGASLVEDEWLKDALNDLLNPDVDGLRAFLRKAGAELPDGREVFIPLAQLYRVLECESSPAVSVQEAVSILLKKPCVARSKSIRSIVVEKAVSVVDALNDDSFFFFWDNVQLVPNSLLQRYARKVGLAVWSRDPSLIISFILGTEMSSYEGTDFLGGISCDQLVNGIDNVPQLTVPVIKIRPDLLSKTNYWMVTSSPSESLNMAVLQGLQTEAVMAMMMSGRSDLVQIARKVLSPQPILDALCKFIYMHPKDDSSKLQRWVNVISSDSLSINEFLINNPGIPRKLLFLLSNVSLKKSVGHQFEHDPWLAAWNASSGVLGERETTVFMSHLLIRAFRAKSSDASQLAKVSFSTVHEAIAANRISEQCWRDLEECLSRSFLWWTKDRAQRMEQAVVDMFIERDFHPSDFVSLTGDSVLFSRLIGYASQRSLGRKYLKRIKKIPENERSKIPTEYFKIVNDVIYRNGKTYR